MRYFLAVVCLMLTSVFSAFSQQDANQVAASAPAVVPRVIRFSGQMKDASRTVGITFTLHRGQHDTSALWSETQNVALDASGNYKVLLGATKAEGLPADLFSTGEAQWLGIRVEGQTEQPRVLLVSVPYALRAAEADTLSGHAASEFVTSEKLSSVVQEQLQRQTSTPQPPKKSSAAPSVVSNPATNFVDNTSSQVVGVTQNGSGAGILATAVTGNAIRGSSAGTAIYGTSTGAGNAALQGSSSSTTGKGIYGFATAASGINYGVLGSTASPQGIGIYGYNNATTGTPIGILGATLATSGTAIKASANASTGANTGLLATTASPAGTAAVLQNTASGKLLSGQTGAAHTEVFSVSGGGTGSFTGVGAPAIVGDVGCFGPSAGISFVSSPNCTGYTLLQQASDVFVNRPTGGTLHFRQGNVEEMTVDTAGDLIAGGGATVASGDGRLVLGGEQHFPARLSSSGEVFDSAWSGGAFFGGAGISHGGYGLYAVGGSADNGNGGVGIFAAGGTNGGIPGLAYAGDFGGDVRISGTLNAPSVQIAIDHPLDPANKYLHHAPVESSEMMNVYSGNATTDGAGLASVPLPDWFESLNEDFRYQLTVIGQFAQAIVKQKVANHRFTILTDKPNVEVSWMITGVRRDAYAKAHALKVEEDKPEVERGYYFHPELYGAPEEKQIEWARHPEVMRRLRDAAKVSAAK